MASDSHLQFPLALDSSDVDCRASDAVSMSSDAASEDGLSSVSLADSTYEIVSNHPDQTLDHAEESDFTAPDDTRSIDEVSTFSEPHMTHDEDELDESALLVNASAKTPTVQESQASLMDHQHDSVMTSGTIVSGEDVGTSPFSFPSLPQTPTHYFSVPLARYPLRLTRPLRIIYHGPETHRIEILDKIAQAVATSAKPESHLERAGGDGFSKYQVIPVPWQDAEGATPSWAESRSRVDVTLIPSSGVEIAVQICDLCNDSAKDHLRAYCRGRCADGQVCATRGPTDYQSPSDKHLDACNNTCHQGGFCKLHRMSHDARMKLKLLPDLAVYFHLAGHAAPGMSTCASSCSYMCSADTSAKGIPVLDIAEDRRFSTADIPIFEPSMGLAAHCTELQPLTSDPLTRPLDLDGFFALDNVSLNHNIAALTGHHDGLFGLNIPSLKDARATLTNTLRSRSIVGDPSRRNFIAVVLTLSIGLIWSMLTMPGVSKLPEISVDAQLKTAPAAVETVSAVWAHMQKGLVLASQTPDAPVPTEIASPAIAWSTGCVDESKRAPRLSRLVTSSDDDYVVSLPAHLAALRRPPEMFASAVQAGNALEVQLVKINATAAKIDLTPLMSLDPVEIVVATRSKSSRSFRTVITCLKRSPNAYALQTRSFYSIATTLFGSLGERWVSLALSEAERLYLMTRHWLEMTLHEVKDGASNMRDSSTRLYQDGKLFVQERNPFSKKAVETRIAKSSDALCIRRRLQESKSRTALGAELYCKSRRLSASLSKSWNGHTKAYMQQFKSSRALSAESYAAYKARVSAYGDETLSKARRRALKLTQNLRHRVEEARSRAYRIKHGSKSGRARRDGRLRRKGSKL